ncbi:MAG: DUF2062 domain-containing protein [Pseudomonadota bacterium]
MPDHHKVRTHKRLQFLGTLLHDPNIWHFNRQSASGGVAVGLFWAMIPMPFQMIPAAACAVWFRVNLPISVALVWLTNPVTMPPIFYGAYRLGSWILGTRVRNNLVFEMSVEWLTGRLSSIWQPLLLGSLVLAVAASVIGYVTVRLLWRLRVVLQFRVRKNRRVD